MKGKNSFLELNVAEAVIDDEGKRIVRIDTSNMKKMDVVSGDAIEINGKKKTVAIAEANYPGDIGLDIIRMDALIKKNAGAAIRTKVKVKKAKTKNAEKVMIASENQGLSVLVHPEFLSKSLKGRPLRRGDIIKLEQENKGPFKDIFEIIGDGIGFMTPDIKFKVKKVIPSGSVTVTANTEIECEEEEIEDELSKEPLYFVRNHMKHWDKKIRKVKKAGELRKLKKEILEVRVEVTKPVLDEMERQKERLIKKVDKKLRKKVIS